MNLLNESIKTLAFLKKNWIMSNRNVFTLFELFFWPCIWLFSVGLMITFLKLKEDMAVFLLIGVVSMSVVQACQLDVAYVLLFDMWSKSLKHQFITPISGFHLVLGSWLMGVLRGIFVFLLLALSSMYFFGFNLFSVGLSPLGIFLFGLFLNSALIGLTVCILVLVFGQRAEVAAWSLVSLMLLVCGIYYPVSLLPKAIMAIAQAIPLTYMLEYFRSFYGFPYTFSHTLAKGYGLSLLYLTFGILILEKAIQRARKTGLLVRLSE